MKTLWFKGEYWGTGKPGQFVPVDFYLVLHPNRRSLLRSYNNKEVAGRTKRGGAKPCRAFIVIFAWKLGESVRYDVHLDMSNNPEGGLWHELSHFVLDYWKLFGPGLTLEEEEHICSLQAHFGHQAIKRVFPEYRKLATKWQKERKIA